MQTAIYPYPQQSSQYGTEDRQTFKSKDGKGIGAIIIQLIDDMDKPRYNYAQGDCPDGSAHDEIRGDSYLLEEVPAPQYERGNGQCDHYPVPIYSNGAYAKGDWIDSDIDFAPSESQDNG